MRFLADTGRDLSGAVRTLGRNPGFTALAAVTLALGVGGCAAMYAYAQRVVFAGEPYPDRASLVVIQEEDLASPGESRGVGSEAFVHLRDESHAIRAIAGYNTDGMVVSGDRGVRILEGVLYTGDLFGLLGVEPLLGRLPGPGERAAVLGERTWRADFGGQPDVVGRTVELNRELYPVVGVMPEAFWRERDVWVPLERTPAEAGRLRTWARLGGSPEDAQAELDVLTRRLAAREGVERPTWALAARDPFAVSGGRMASLLAAGVLPVALVFLIACANIAHLEMARNAKRGRELAVRQALGASFGRLARRLLTESLLLALLGGAAGVVIALWGLRVMAAYLPVGPLSFDVDALGLLLLLAAATTAAIGLAPALAAARRNLAEALKAGGRGQTGRRSGGALIVSELACSTMLLVGAGMMIVLAQQASRVELGFDAENLWTTRLSLRGALAEPDARAAWAAETLERVTALPNVASAAVATELPLLGGHRRRLDIPGASDAQAEYRLVSPAYFDTLGVSVWRGRGLTADDRAGARAVAVVNETLARRYFDGNAVGRLLRVYPEETGLGTAAEPQVREIVGIVADVRQEASAAPAPPVAYAPFAQDPVAPLSLLVRTRTPPSPVGREILGALEAPSPEIVVLSAFEYEGRLAEAARGRRFLPLSITIFATLGLILAGVGLYGTTLRGVEQRIPEMGVRQALGAARSDVSSLILRESARAAAAGIALGATGALAAARLFLASLEPGERAAFGVDLLSSGELAAAGAGALALLLAAVLLASWLPARRAARIEPLAALRYE